MQTWAHHITLLVVALGGGSVAAPPGHAVGTSTVIVDWGGDYVTTDTAMARYITVEYPVDLDGGTNDARGYLPFSDTAPLNPDPAGGNAYGGTYATDVSYRFYGGILFHHYDRPFDSKWAEVWDRGAQDRIYQSADATSDGWALIYWKKEDFLGVGPGASVQFDAASALEILNYAGADGVVDNNYGEVRFVVRDGAQFYVSEDVGDKATSDGFRLSDVAAARWAPYTPTPPYSLQFDRDHAVFSSHSFASITAVGFYHATDASSAADRRAGLNLERFRVTAAVQTSMPTPQHHIQLPLCIR